MKIRLKLRDDKPVIEFEKVKEWFFQNDYLVIVTKIKKAVKLEPINLSDINFYEIV